VPPDDGVFYLSVAVDRALARALLGRGADNVFPDAVVVS